MRILTIISFALFVTACGSDARVDDDAPDHPTWYQHVAPLVAGHCQSCHSAGGIAPFALETYDDAAPMAPRMAAMVQSGQMPPFAAVSTSECTPVLPFKDDPSLSPDEVAMLQTWADQGAPAGDAATAAPLPPATSRALAGVTHDVAPLGSWTTSGTRDQFECLVYDPGLASDMWLTGIEFRPTDRGVVHHAVAFADPARASAALAGASGVYDCFGGIGIAKADPLGGYTPGALPFETMPGTGIKLTAGSLIVVQVHYHPLASATPVRDATALGLRLSTARPGRTAAFVAVGNTFKAPELQADPDDRGAVEFRIPAGAPAHVETMDIALPVKAGETVPVFAVYPHMHYVGTKMQVMLRHADGTQECLVDADRYDFQWQRLYAYDGSIDQLPHVRTGDTLQLRCTYNNTRENPNVMRALAERGLSAPVDVVNGEQTLDEMCIVLAGGVVP